MLEQVGSVDSPALLERERLEVLKEPFRQMRFLGLFPPFEFQLPNQFSLLSLSLSLSSFAFASDSSFSVF
jgi:hypothetical protein